MRHLKTNPYIVLLMAQLFMIVLASFMQHHVVLYMLFAVSLLGVLGSVVAAIWKSYLTRLTAITSGGIAFAGSLVAGLPVFGDELRMVSLIVCGFSYSVFTFIAILSLLKIIFVVEKRSMSRIAGSVCIYVLIGIFFAFLYATIDLINPKALGLASGGADSIKSFGEYLYFSYVTMTTIGYGDVVPAIPISRLFSMIEGLIGPVYLAIMVAGLVGFHVSESITKRIKEES